MNILNIWINFKKQDENPKIRIKSEKRKGIVQSLLPFTEKAGNDRSDFYLNGNAAKQTLHIYLQRYLQFFIYRLTLFPNDDAPGDFTITHFKPQRWNFWSNTKDTLYTFIRVNFAKIDKN